MAKTPKIIVQKATAFQLNPKNSYMIHLPNAEPEDCDVLKDWLHKQGIENVVIISVETMEVSEVDKFTNVVK